MTGTSVRLALGFHGSRSTDLGLIPMKPKITPQTNRGLGLGPGVGAGFGEVLY